MADDDFEPRPNDFLVEPMFAPFEPQSEPQPEPQSEPEPLRWYTRLFAWVLRRG